MRKIDQDGSYRFSDASVGQMVMFRGDNPDFYATQMHTRFKGTIHTFDTLLDYALNETPFLNPKAMLEILEKSDRIIVDASEPRRIGTFNEAKIRTINFV